MSMTVTADSSGLPASRNGIVLRVLVLTNVKATGSPTGFTGGQTGVHAHQVTGTPTALHSSIYGGIFNGNTAGGTMAGLNGNCTQIDGLGDSGIGQYTTYRDPDTLSLTSTSYGSAASFNGGVIASEILAATSAGLTEDGSGPAVAHAAAAQITTTASFSPPNGSFLLAIAVAASAGNVITPTDIDITDSMGLTWTQIGVAASGNGNGIATTWYAWAGTQAGTAISSSDASSAAADGQSISAQVPSTDILTSNDGGEGVRQTGPYPTGDTGTAAEGSPAKVAFTATGDTGSVNASTGEAGVAGVGVVVYKFDFDTTNKISTATPHDTDAGHYADNQSLFVSRTGADTGHAQDGF